MTVSHLAEAAQAAIEIVVDDDGVGAGVGTVDGRGLTGMRERATSLGGTFEAGAGFDGGFTVRAFLPVADATVTSVSESLR